MVRFLSLHTIAEMDAFVNNYQVWEKIRGHPKGRRDREERPGGPLAFQSASGVFVD
jgi:hypothetical protein